MGRLLAFSFDGTGNDPDDAGGFANDRSITNILKLHILMGGGCGAGPSETDDGLLHYYSGIGTLENGSEIPLVGRTVAWLSRAVNKGIAPRWLDARRILGDAVDDLRRGYSPGDRVAAFGFSRGAALARKFAAIALENGIVPQVDFVGVYDTVATMRGDSAKRGRISDVVFADGTLHKGIARAVHLVALDEERIPFAPTLMDRNDADDAARIAEMWLPGSHGDVGGGFWSDGLSDIALDHMVHEFSIAAGISPADVRRTGNIGEFENGIVADDVAINPQVAGRFHENYGIIARMGYLEPRNVRVDRNGAEDPDVEPVVHWSAKERYRVVPGYRPKALRGRKYRIWKHDELGDVVHGVDGLRFDFP